MHQGAIALIDVEESSELGLVLGSVSPAAK
jgi:hypothetical protein